MLPNIIIADDHSMIRKGLKIYLQLNLNQQLITETSSCRELMNTLIKEEYTHLILDIILADGSTLEIIPNIRKLYPKLNILMFSMQPGEIYGEALKHYGIFNYLSKSATEEEILSMLGKFINNKTVNTLAPEMSETHNPFQQLSPRELEILHYLLNGHGTKNIADTLNLKMNTVSTIKSRIYEKINVTNIRELIELAGIYNVNY